MCKHGTCFIAMFYAACTPRLEGRRFTRNRSKTPVLPAQPRPAGAAEGAGTPLRRRPLQDPALARRGHCGANPRRGPCCPAGQRRGLRQGGGHSPRGAAPSPPPRAGRELGRALPNSGGRRRHPTLARAGRAARPLPAEARGALPAGGGGGPSEGGITAVPRARRDALSRRPGPSAAAGDGRGEPRRQGGRQPSKSPRCLLPARGRPRAGGKSAVVHRQRSLLTLGGDSVSGPGNKPFLQAPEARRRARLSVS